MSPRFWMTALLVAVGLASQSGCCHTPFCGTMFGPPWPCGNTYYGKQCGCKYSHWWFSHKPDCCQHCDQCGYFLGSDNPYVESGPPYTPYGPLYSDGSGSNQPGAAGQLYSEPSGPTPAEPPDEGVLDDAAPLDDMQNLPMPTTSMPRRGGQRMAMRRYGPVDSIRGSRTLGRSPRTHLFSR